MRKTNTVFYVDIDFVASNQSTEIIYLLKLEE
jgi:hypothetical protein